MRLSFLGLQKQQAIITVSKVTVNLSHHDIVEVSILKPDNAFQIAIGKIEQVYLFKKKIKPALLFQ